MVCVVVHGGPLITVNNLATSKCTWNQLYFTFRIISPMASKISWLLVQRWQWVNHYLRWVNGVVARTGGSRGYSIWIDVITRLKLFESLSLGFKLIDEKLWTLLSIWLIYSIKCKVLNNWTSIRLSLHWCGVMLQHAIALLKFELKHRFGFIHFVSLHRIDVGTISRSDWSSKWFDYRFFSCSFWLLNNLRLRKIA